jgi:hypothetical protein
MRLLLLSHLILTALLCGILWYVQQVHYPAFQYIGRQAFGAFETFHRTATSQIVGPLMLAELITGLVLAAGSAPRWVWLLNLGLILICWVVTFWWAVPLHDRFQAGFDPEALKALLAVNWVRTVIWTARVGLVGWVALSGVPV